MEVDIAVAFRCSPASNDNMYDVIFVWIPSDTNQTINNQITNNDDRTTSSDLCISTSGFERRVRLVGVGCLGTRCY